jgi:hypothetical protein
VSKWAQRSDPVNIHFSDEPLAAVGADKSGDLALIDTAADCCRVNAEPSTSIG